MKITLNNLPVEEIISRLKNGEAVHYEGSCNGKPITYKLVDDVLVRFVGSTPQSVGEYFNISDSYYFDDGAAITTTGMYTTRSGSNAYVSMIVNNVANGTGIAHGAIEGCGKHITWYLDGRRYSSRISDDDIVGV